MTEGPATEYARTVPTWHPEQWWDVESKALGSARDLRVALAHFAPASAWKGLSRNVPTALGCLLTIANIASFTLPVIAAFLMIGWLVGTPADDPLRPVAPVGIAGILAAIAAVIAGIGLIDEARSPDRASAGIGRLLGALHLVPSAAAALIAVIAIAQQSAGGVLGILGLVLDLAVGILHFVVYRGPATDQTRRWHRNLARLESARDAVPEPERARILADIRGAVDALVGRDLVSDEDGLRALAAPVGMLGMTMAPRADLTPGGGRSA
ncbi:hypothetical protein [Microbacterium kribbense]